MSSTSLAIKYLRSLFLNEQQQKQRQHVSGNLQDLLVAAYIVQRHLDQAFNWLAPAQA